MSSITRLILVATTVSAVQALIENCGGYFDIKSISIKDGSLRSNAYFSLNITLNNNYRPVNNPIVLYHLQINKQRYLPQIDTLCAADCQINMGNRSLLLHNNIPKLNEEASMRIELRSQRMEKLACIRFPIGKETLFSKMLSKEIIGNLTEVPKPIAGLIEAPEAAPTPLPKNRADPQGFLDRLRTPTHI